MTLDDYHSARNGAPATDEPALRECLDSSEQRRDAALALIDVADRQGLDDRTVDALDGVVREATDPEARQYAVEALGTAGVGTESVRRALDDDHEWVRAEAVVALSRTDPSDTDRLESAIEDDSGWVRRNAIVALGKLGAVDQPLLVDRIKSDGHPAVREYAAQFLGEVTEDTEAVVRILAAVLAREPNAYVRAKAADSLGELGTDRAEEALESQGLHDRSEDVRRTARVALASARGTDPEEIDLPDSGETDGSPPMTRPPGGADAPSPTDPRGPDQPQPSGPGPAPSREYDGGDHR
ncbi:HEAT repeat domain-containing protein [Halomicroarcula sp. GCM10025709]|uniref:HEAT repeat domain-containing protein n=1 Tax=Haloarcula TaxID=2237 RepID=UPI0024C2C423|nr:HEAT repeat domain-containing protein [Halomicroarcula sp. YJ-61-S]